jgi:FkbM family methyltransferase
MMRTLNMLRNIQNWTEYLTYKAGGKKAPEFEFKLRNGTSIKVPKQIIPEFKESFFEEVYFKHLPAKIFSVKNPTIIDIGANVGYFTLLASYRLNNPRIISFEPIKRNFEILQKNTLLIKPGVATIVNKAVNNIPGELTLTFESQSITTSASLFSKAGGDCREVVSATSLEEIFTQYKLDKIDLLKLDCEGAEYNILYNTPKSLFKLINCIAMETHRGSNKNENMADLAEYLKNLGYLVKTNGFDLIWAWKKNWV